ncbi:MAG: HDOD domain-containing protein [Gammaproteobacteria bacterium]|nr:HDOD domain-containing protein [Gammaproteobacteria bacterium]
MAPRVRSWLRVDEKLGVGVCSECSEWVAAWDRGVRHATPKSDGEARSEASAPEGLDNLIRQAVLPSLPHVLLEVYDILASEVSSSKQIAALLETDAGLTARALRLGNSAFYGMSRKVSSVSEVMLLIGAFDLWWLLFTTEVKDLFFGIDRQLMDMNRFWKHSLFTACASRVISEKYRLGRPGELFVSGLLHDIGKLLMLQQIPVDYHMVLKRASEGEVLIDVERDLLGYTHEQASAALLEHWKLPASLISAVGEHHLEVDTLSDKLVVAAANRLAHRVLEESEEELPEEVLKIDVNTEINPLYERMVNFVT